MNKLIFGYIEVSEKEFYESKKAMNLEDVIVDNIVVNNKIKGNNETSKVFIGYVVEESVVPLRVILTSDVWMDKLE